MYIPLSILAVVCLWFINPEAAFLLAMIIGLILTPILAIIFFIIAGGIYIFVKGFDVYDEKIKPFLKKLSTTDTFKKIKATKQGKFIIENPFPSIVLILWFGFFSYYLITYIILMFKIY